MQTDRKEALRYLGLGKHEPDPETERLLEECIRETEKAADLRHLIREYPLTIAHHTEKALPQPGLGRVADGFPAQMDGHSLWDKEPADIPRLTEDVPNRSKRMKTLGNAVSPPQVFPILKYIADIETGRCPMGGEEL